MFGLGTTELIIIGVIIFFIFGARRLPEIGKGLGGALREFRKVKKDLSVTEENSSHQNNEAGDKSNSSLESKLTSKVVEQIPGAKEAADLKKKVEEVKKLVD
ncbi:twin-arginine translocase TatA/TatE family subunit [Thermodesulfobacteriota bacterium]